MKLCLNCFEEIKDELEICPFCGYIEGADAGESVHIRPGTVLEDRYIIGRVLGYGGFGVTYAGWDRKLEQKLAIKEYFPSEFSTRAPGQTRLTISNGINKEYFNVGLDRFIDEAKKLSRFQNEEGIVRIYDCIAANDTAYIIMEYLEGETLSNRLRKTGSLSETEAISILMPVMKSLESVHCAGIIHRDIAPDNIILTNDGRIKLIDFGSARYKTAEFSRSLTVIVKPGYSAEEQYRSNSEQGTYTDVYSLAATLYKMVTGTTPPDALERRERIEQRKKDLLTRPGKINNSISLVVENAILNAMNIRIEDRTPTIEEFIEELTSEGAVKRVHGQIKRTDMYSVPLWLKILVPSVLGLILLAGVLLATGVISFQSMFRTSVEVPYGYTTIPNVEGLDVDSAVEMLNENRLDYVTGGNVISDYIDADLIVYQDPESSKVVEINSLVTLIVSRGTGEVILPVDGISTVPAFLWGEEEDAVRDFETAGLVPSVEYVFNENVTVGQVISVLNEDGEELHVGDELEEGEPIVIIVSGGPDPIESTEPLQDSWSEDSLTPTDPAEPYEPVVSVGVDVLNIEDHSYACFVGCGSWEEARDFCKHLGGHLAVISSQIENDALSVFAQRCGYGNSYIGYSDSANEGVWQWAYNESSDFVNWNEGEPNAFTGAEDYVAINSEGMWNDGDYNYLEEPSSACFICEWDYYVSGLTNIDYYELMTDYLLEVAEAGSGEITVSLMWTGHDDLDLHILTPNGSEIYYANREAQGGLLDVDANPNEYSLVDYPVENIYFENPDAGTYTVWIYNYNDRTSGSTDYSVRVTIGEQSRMFEGTINGNQSIDIIEFVYGDGGIVSENYPEEQVNPVAPDESFNFSYGLEYTVDSSGAATIVGIGDCTDSIVNIPSSTGYGEEFSAIGADAFAYCTSIYRVIIPSSVVSIGDWAFWDSSVSVVDIPNSVTRIGRGAFLDCININSLQIPESVSFIGAFAFSGCTNLTSITLPSYSDMNTDNLFNGCSALTSVSIPDGTTNVSTNTFRGCTSLTTISIPDSVNVINSGAFSDCPIQTVNGMDPIVWAQSRGFDPADIGLI